MRVLRNWLHVLLWHGLLFTFVAAGADVPLDQPASQQISTSAHSDPPLATFSPNAPPDSLFSGMFRDLNFLIAEHDQSRSKYNPTPNESNTLSQGLIEDAMDRLLPSLRIRALISLLDLEAFVAEDEEPNLDFKVVVDFSDPDVSAQVAKLQSLYASKRARRANLVGGSCDEICSHRNEISRCTTSHCLCDEGLVKELGKCAYCVTERIKSERFTAEAEGMFAGETS
ncbi:uncharacterized protein EI90DRAFT_3127072 [Cantharellus anzutake]|uniref:uncharacterized protein n=1 Tax=Cantharellus anzutake TaxID=1750568 RepID=UPI0019070091|nr:uncharacterized protein EI90DRAFT_3127072 [Cantharellus anzutake]KAF8327405.1 hypothetical protein EI90DRAFT_3127072 [Cantharellus anzutake]